MKKFLLFLLPLSLILASCDNVDPVVYNDTLVNYSNDTDRRIEEFTGEINNIFESEEFSKIAEIGKVTIDSLNADIAKMNSLKQPSGAEDFHNATVAYSQAYISYIQAISDEYSKITDATTEEEMDNMDLAINKVEEVTQTKFDEMVKAQSEFAKAKKFDLVNKNL